MYLCMTSQHWLRQWHGAIRLYYIGQCLQRDTATKSVTRPQLYLKPWVAFTNMDSFKSQWSVGWNYSSFPKLWKLTSNFITRYNGCDYVSVLGLKLIHVSKMKPLWPKYYGQPFHWRHFQVRFLKNKSLCVVSNFTHAFFPREPLAIG